MQMRIIASAAHSFNVNVAKVGHSLAAIKMSSLRKTFLTFIYK